jgi:hypothetical protein
MSRKWDPWDDVMMDGFFVSFKIEWINEIHATEERARRVVLECVEMFYRLGRGHIALRHVSPVEYE